LASSALLPSYSLAARLNQILDFALQAYVSERDALKSGLAVTPHYRYTLFFREDALLQIAAHI
jgi:hypothetical protein